VLLILIPIAWLTVVTVVVAACCMAARADDAHLKFGDARPRSVRNMLIVWDARATLALNVNRPAHDRRPLEHRAPLRARRPTRRGRRFAHPVR
jgi:hypothetical protein